MSFLRRHIFILKDPAVARARAQRNMAKDVHNQGSSFTGEMHDAIHGVPAFEAIRSGKPDVTGNDVRLASELTQKIQTEASSRISAEMLSFL